MTSDPSLVALGLLQRGDLDGAQAMFEYALGQRVAAFGADHPAVATEVANFGNLLAEQHDLVGARAYLERALALHERAFGQHDPEVALDLGNLGLVMLDLGELDTARSLFDRALSIQVAAFGAEHQRTALALANLASVVRQQGDAAQARALPGAGRAHLSHPTWRTRRGHAGGAQFAPTPVEVWARPWHKTLTATWSPAGTSVAIRGAEPPGPARRGIFDEQSSLFVQYRARLQMRDKLLGGIPKDPQLIEGWLRRRAGLTETDEIRHVMLRTPGELGIEASADMSFEQLEKASAAVAARKQTTGFKVGEQRLYVEARQVKAMLKESTNVVFGGDRFGPTRKGARPFVAERIFVEPERLWLGASKPHGVEMTIGHLIGPTGPRSIVGYHEYVRDATLEFRVLTMRDCLSAEQWADLWVHAQENGLGALRSQGFGRFYIEHWERIS